MHIEGKEAAEANYAKSTEMHCSLVGSVVLIRFKNTFDIVVGPMRHFFCIKEANAAFAAVQLTPLKEVLALAFP